MNRTATWGLLAAAITTSGCDDSGPTGPDFERSLAPGEYQVLVTGNVERSFEGTGASYVELGTAPFIGFERATLNMMGEAEALNGADFNLCSPAEPATLGFDATTQFTGCPSDPARVTGGFIVQLGAPNEDELDCYGNGYGDKDFEGVLTITAVTGDEIQGETQGSGMCSRHPHSEIEPMRSVAVTVRVRFRAVRQAT